jgi:hypothetical protein
MTIERGNTYFFGFCKNLITFGECVYLLSGTLETNRRTRSSKDRSKRGDRAHYEKRGSKRELHDDKKANLYCLAKSVL